MSKWSDKAGVPEDLRAYLSANGATRAFWEQRRNARRRGVAWEFTLGEWWQVWEASGRWEQRGRGGDRFCMGRIGDAGAYRLGNVYICAGWENSVGGPLRVMPVGTHVPGIKPRCRRWEAFFRSKRLGLFVTKAEAIAARAEAQHCARVALALPS